MIGYYADLARTHAALLIITVPLIGAALASLLPSARLSWGVAMLASFAAAALAVDLCFRHLVGDAPFVGTVEGAALRLDGAGVFGAALVSVGAPLLAIAAGGVLRDFHPRAAPFALALLLCASAGWSGALLAQDYAGVFIAMETGWLAQLGLVALSGERDRGAFNGALRMLGAGSGAAALFLVGAALVSRSVGSTEVIALANTPVTSPGMAGAGVGLMLVALAIKTGVAPLHFWTGAAYGRAGSLPALALGALGAIGALGLLLRVAAHAMAAPVVGEGVSAALAALGVASVVIGSFQAAGATNLRRLAGYASAAQAGCILLTAALGSPAAFAAAFVQLFAMSAAALALLGGASAVGAGMTLHVLDGLGRRAPLASAAIMVGALSLMGAPLTIGFLGRWRMIEAGVGAGWWWATGAVIAASLAAVFYAGRLIERIYFRRAHSAVENVNDMWRLTLAPALAAAILAIALGLEPSLLLRAAERASALLLGEAA